jgi:hypothetical protein
MQAKLLPGMEAKKTMLLSAHLSTSLEKPPPSLSHENRPL